MIWIDIVCIVCIVIFALLGLWRGILRSIFRFLAWAGAIVGAYLSQSLFADTIATNLELSGFSVTLICICIGFLIPFLAFSFIGHIVHKAISETAVSKVNRIFGAVLGLLKALIICFAFLSVLHILPVSGSLKDARDSSISYAVYKGTLELMGFSSGEVDLIGAAERKAEELSREITDKAVEKAKETATQAAEDAKNAAEETAKQAIDDAKAKTAKAIDEATDAALKKATETADGVKDAAGTAKQ